MMSYCPMCAMSPNEVFALREEAAALRARIAALEGVITEVPGYYRIDVIWPDEDVKTFADLLKKHGVEL